MKVAGPTSAPRASAARPAARAGTGAFRIEQSDAAAAGAVAQTGAAGAAGALLALQDEGGRRARSAAALERILDALESVQRAIVGAGGEISADSLAHLANAASAKIDASDPRLAAIAEEIVCRARIELAKRGL